MKTEELLRPRWKVISDYPKSVFNIGDILINNSEQNEYEYINWEDYGKDIYYPDNYPTIFKKLNWWEERDESELPNYIKIQHTVPIPTYQKLNGIYKIKEYVTWGMKVEGIEEVVYFSKYTVPATEQEYLNQ